MDERVRNHAGRREIVSLNIDDLDINELERRLEMAVADVGETWSCRCYSGCECPRLISCVSFCEPCDLEALQ